MLRLVYAFVEICLHRRGPDQLPKSRFLFGLVVVGSVGVSLFVLHFANVARDRVVPIIVVDLAFGLAFIWSVLKAFSVEQRFLQTASAILGTDALMNLASLPFALWHRALHAPEGSTTVPSVIYLLIAGVWAIDVGSFVVSRAISRPYVLALAVVLAYVLLDVSLSVTLFPPPPN